MDIILSIALILFIVICFVVIDVFMVKYFHKCPYCGKNMTFTHTKESNGNIYYVFKCPNCGAWDEVPEENIIGHKIN